MTSERAAAAALAFSVALLGSCGGYERGIRVQVALRPEPPTLAFETDLGYRVRLERAVVRVASVRIQPCEARAAHGGLSLGVAFAHHVDTTPNQGEGGAPLDLLHANGRPISITTLRPPPGRYCAAEITFGAGAADPEGPAVELAGVAARDGAAHPFTWAVPAQMTAEIRLDPPLALSPTALDGRVEVRVDQRRWLDGQDFAADTATPDLDALARHLSAPAGASTETTP